MASRRNHLRFVRIVLLFVALLLSRAGVCRAETSAPRLITTTGTSEVEVAPDQVTVHVSVNTKDKVLLTAVANNNETTKSVLAVGAKYKIDMAKIKTSNETIEPTYETSADGHRDKQSGYEVDKYITMESKPDVLENLITDLITSGANRVSGITFSTSRSRELRDKARFLAIAVAKEKASAIAKALDQQIGLPWKIDETNGNSPSFSTNNIRQAVSFEPTDQDIVEPGRSSVSIGTITIRASVTASFELK